MTAEKNPTMDIGVISDTHGLLRPEALERLAGCGLIIHAGDVGSLSVLEGISAIAPVEAVRGNVDAGALVDLLPLTCELEASGLRIFVIHQLEGLDLLHIDPASLGFDIVVYGHSHRPAVQWHGQVLYLNPGSAGPRRFDLPVSLARIRIEDGRACPELIDLV
jgi:uncharacterized protein